MEAPPLLPPKDRFTALDTLALARELAGLDHPRLDKVFDHDGGGWIISFRTRSDGRRDLLVIPGKYGAISPEPLPHPEVPEGLAVDLRRLLAGSLLGSVTDPAGERVLEMEFVRADGSPSIRLVAELFPPGNLLAIRDGRLVAVAQPRTFAARTLRIGADYRPAPRRPDPFRASAGQLEVLLLGSRTDRVSTLAARAGFGGPLAEELLDRAGLPGDPPAPQDAGETGAAVAKAAAELLVEIGTEPRGYLYLRDGQAVDAAPIRLRRRGREPGTVEQVRDHFGSAVLEYFRNRPAAPAPKPAGGSAVDGLVRQQDRQREAIDRLRSEAELKVAQANRIFEHYVEAQEARANADPDGPATIEVELGDLKVPLERDRPLEASARSLYDEAKRAKQKLAGAREALEATKVRLERAEPPASEVPSVPKVPERPRLWFERFRWFVSSEGILVLAGRDAGSNDQVVRKYLREGDRYLHADLHGAASVIVKRSATPGAPEAGESTLREAGEFAVAFSKAWRAGHASADAFWVLPEQVSKAAASGEFVARGAWVIHGTKHALRDLPLELALGTILYEGATRWTAAPVAAVRKLGEVARVITPGEERHRSELERELVRDLAIPRPVLQTLLPAGGIAVRRA
jgi:predicted ribosome quality control (RQC) complex YloA/Tae2 family protein